MVEVRKEQTPEEAVQDHAPKEQKEPKEAAGTANDTGDGVDEEVLPEQGEADEQAPGESTGEAEAAEGEIPEGENGEPGPKEDGEPCREKKKGLKKKQKKDKKDEKIEELNDRLVRNLAEFENFRNRSEKEKSAMFDMGAKSVVEKILPVVDNLERGFEGLSDQEKETPFVKGIEAVYKQIQTVFEELGVTPIEAVGKEFDPNIHNAVMHDEDDSEETNKVIEEFQKGYLYKDSVVRHSMVKVLN